MPFEDEHTAGMIIAALFHSSLDFLLIKCSYLIESTKRYSVLDFLGELKTMHCTSEIDMGLILRLLLLFTFTVHIIFSPGTNPPFLLNRENV